MNRINACHVLAICFVLLVGVGCSQDFQVEVQRMQPAGGITDTTVQLDPARVEAVTRSVATIREYVALERRIQTATEPTAGLLAARADAETARVAGELRSSADTASDRARELLNEGTSLLEDMGRLPGAYNRYPTTRPREDYEAIARMGTRMRTYPLDVAFFLEHNPVRTTVDQAVREAQEANRRHLAPVTQQAARLRTMVLGWGTTMSSLRTTAETAASDISQPSFGGFTNHGVYMISPGDAKYGAMLAGQPVGDPVTSAKTHSSGTSTVVFVQESPTHMRIFSVDMNSDQIVKNVVYIGDKVLQAAVQSMVPVP